AWTDCWTTRPSAAHLYHLACCVRVTLRSRLCVAVAPESHRPAPGCSFGARKGSGLLGHFRVLDVRRPERTQCDGRNRRPDLCRYLRVVADTHQEHCGAEVKLSKTMTLVQFDNGYWYVAELRRFADTIGVPAAGKVRKDELEKVIKHFLATGKIESPPR